MFRSLQHFKTFIKWTIVACISLSAAMMNPANSQDISEFREFEDSLVVLSQKIYLSQDEVDKYAANERFMVLLNDALSLNNSFRYPFDSVRYISKLVSPDKRFRIFTWMIARADGTYEYFGFLQSFSRRKNDYEVYPLTDVSEGLESPETKVMDHKGWYGAVYYEVILTKDGANRYYTLLGWDGNSALVKRKVIEVMTLRSNGMPRFGQSLFRYDRPNLKRVIFEYSSLATMTLRYEKQHYYEKRERLIQGTSKKKKKKKRVAPRVPDQTPNLFQRWFLGWQPGAPPPPRGDHRFRRVRKGDDMIVFDHLIPTDPSLTGQRQYYVPEGNIVHAFRFTRGRWHWVEDIDARNPSNRYDNPRKRPKPELQPARN